MVKFLSLLLFAIVASSGIFLSVASAHPGSNSWDGCHYCWTNCGKWGYTEGTRHCKKAGMVPQFGPADPKIYGTRRK